MRLTGKSKPQAANPAPTSARRKLQRPGGGALVLISGLFLASGLVRAADGAQGLGAQILARADEGGLIATLPTAPGPCQTPPDLEALFSDLRQREADLARAEAEVADRLQAAAIAGEEISQQITELRVAEAALAATLMRAETSAEDDLARLTTVYENMKPKDAAPLFEQMEPGFAAGFLARMRPDAAAAIMAGLSPPAAYSVSVILAGRNAAAPIR